MRTSVDEHEVFSISQKRILLPAVYDGVSSVEFLRPSVFFRSVFWVHAFLLLTEEVNG